MSKVRSTIIFEDNDLVLINKAAGVPTLPDRYTPSAYNIFGWLTNTYGKIYVVHRLDKETSGLILFAKTAEAHKTLNIAFEERQVKKGYFAIVEGVPSKDEGVIDDPIFISHHGKVKVDQKGKPSISKYKIEEDLGKYSSLNVEIMTGRMHQIRVHLAHIGHPLAVDAKYGRNKALFVSALKGKKFKMKKFEEERPLIERCTLHSRFLEFKHPSTNAIVTFEAPLPKDLRACMNQMKKWQK